MIARRLLAAASALALAGCIAGPGPRPQASDVTLPPAFMFAPDSPTQASVAALLPQDDAAYRGLSELALADAPTLGAALARIDAARAGADRARAERLPSVTAGASVEGTRTNPNQFGAALPPGISIDTTRVTYGANLNASWDVDLFGQLRAQERAARLRVDAATADAAAVRLALLSEIAGSVIDWRTLAAREAAIRDDLTAAEQLTRLAGARERSGIAAGFDRVRAESAAATARSRLAALDSERARLIGRLVTLTAQPAERVTAMLAEPAGGVALRPAPPALPSTLLTARPDIRAAGSRLAAADADVAAAAARRFPKLTLSGTIGLLAFGLGGLLDSDAVVGSLGAGLAGPLLDFGRIAAEIDRTEAETRVAFQNYRGALFTALGDVESAYALIAAADREAAATREEAARAQRSARLADTRFRAGLSDFLTVLDSVRNAQGALERAAAAEGRARRARILLWQALGGAG